MIGLNSAHFYLEKSVSLRRTDDFNAVSGQLENKLERQALGGRKFGYFNFTAAEVT
jgi:hypothetical protein